MSSETVLKTLRHAWLSLSPLQVPMAVMGGLALAAWKHVRTTRDVDILVDMDPQQAAATLPILLRQGFRPKRRPPVVALDKFRVLQMLYEPPGAFVDLQVDLLLTDSEYPRLALARRVPTRLPGLNLDLFVLSCEDMILHKLLSGRIIDRADAAALLRLNRPGLEFAYILGWVGNLALSAEFSEVWREAFPGDAMPSVP
jgi:hypothetical protein